MWGDAGMSFQFRGRRRGTDPDPQAADPVAVAGRLTDGETLAMVRDALDQNRMRLAFQPVVYATDPGIIGYYKGFIRLLDATGRTIPAGDFMALAETQILGRDIDLAALTLALRVLAKHPQVRVAINMSARSIGYSPWTTLLRNTLRRSPDLARSLILEISEASAMQMPDVLIPFLREFRPAGVHFLLDDFGAGETALSRLAEFSFDMAKLDGKFVRGLLTAPQQQTILRAAIALTAEFGMYPIAESVETNAEAEWLRDRGVGCLQGYLFGKPELNPDFSAFRRGR